MNVNFVNTSCIKRLPTPQSKVLAAQTEKRPKQINLFRARLADTPFRHSCQRTMRVTCFKLWRMAVRTVLPPLFVPNMKGSEQKIEWLLATKALVKKESIEVLAFDGEIDGIVLTVKRDWR